VSTHPSPQRLDLNTAAEVVAVPPTALTALAGAGYLAAPHEDDGAGLTFEMADLKAFVARNAENGSGGALHSSFSPDLEPHELVRLLDERAEHMALRMLKMYATVFPKAADWPPARQHKFVQRTKSRFEAMLAVAALGDRFDEEFMDDLQAIGAAAARSRVNLPQILTMLRVARDLVVQNAIELAEDDERHGGYALSLLLTRILPAMDRLGDAITAGYWEAMFPA
jgi:hypothetical protein